MAVQERLTGEIFYPESDGKPLSNSTLQYEWISPLTGARFLHWPGSELEVLRSDGERFRNLFEAETHAAEAEARAEQQRQRADRESDRAARLVAQLRAMGIELEAE